ncbi:ATP-grasp fold amidoligase family protein [Alkalispirillum mobile]|uniref:ATP-grasp fold amidoligase family protein n=1 Tax=Alkalispirillum mobile TaxID=85925 RepID=UPI000EB01077
MVQDPNNPRQLPFDWKFYTFYREVGIILQISRGNRKSTPKAKYYDSLWQNAGRVRGGFKLEDSLPGPNDPTRLLEAAKMISKSVRFPFCRVDLYEDNNGPLLGEVTAYPSGIKESFRSDIDELMGRLWERALSNLFIEDGWDQRRRY